jgi:uncharacterized protein YjiS (DUF1127 family)
VGARRLIGAAGGALALALAGCGATPPQPPRPEADRLTNALWAIASACADAREIQTFTNDPREITLAEHQAEQQVPVLAHVYRRNPSWIFQGKSVGELVSMSSTLLDDCGLHLAARRLRQVTRAIGPAGRGPG